MVDVGGAGPGLGQRPQGFQLREDLLRRPAGARRFRRGHHQQALAAGGVGAVEQMDAVGMAALGGGLGRLQGTADRARQADIDHVRMVRQQEFELPAEIAGRRLAGLRQHQLGAQLAVELGRAQADLVEVIGFAEAQPQRHAVHVQALGDVGRQVGRAVGDHHHRFVAGRRARLRLHVVRFGAFDAAEAGSGLEQRLRIADVGVQADA